MGIIEKNKFDGLPDWPSNTPPQAAGSVAGHNRPPVEIEAKSEFDARIDENAGLRQRIEDLLGAASRAKCDNKDEVARCGATVIQIRNAVKLVDEAHKAAKAPYLEGGRVIDAAKNELAGPLDAAKADIEGKQKGYLRAQQKADDERRAKIAEEERRIQQENNLRAREHAEAVHKAQMEANRLQREAAEQNQPAPVYVAPVIAEPVFIAPPVVKELDRGIVRGPEGGSVSGKLVWKSEVTDYAKAFATVQSNPNVQEAITKAIAAIVKAGLHEIPGVRIWQDVGVTNRG